MRVGLDLLMEDPKRWLKGRRVGLLANPTAVDAKLNHAADLFFAHPDVNLCLLMGPEHGVRGAAQYMEGVVSEVDPTTGVPSVSLYGEHKESLTPTADALAQIDVLVYDIQDVGARYYTYAATLALAVRAAAQAGVEVLVLDRPNPIGQAIEGSGLQPGLESFCGLYPIPQRHGLTVGELVSLYGLAFDLPHNVVVVPCEGWSGAWGDAEGMPPWVMPSPNMPTVDTAAVYPGMCLLEGTNISEGRGTTRPFEIFGAPFLKEGALAKALNALALPGAVFRPCAFVPTFDKSAGELCLGAQLHVRCRQIFQPYRAGIAILHTLRRLLGDAFVWRTELYEFRDDVPAIDLLTGVAEVRQAIDAGAALKEVLAIADAPAEAFWRYVAEARLYGDD